MNILKLFVPVRIFNRLSDKKNIIYFCIVWTAEKEYKALMKLSVISNSNCIFVLKKTN